MSSCTFHRLDVQTQYLSHENLASYYVGTPDPRLNNPIIGQRLLIQWSFHAHEVKGQEVNLYLKVRFRNHEERNMIIPISQRQGFYLYEITDQEYCSLRGILTYQVEIRTDSSMLASWTHPLWTELIKFDFSENES